MELIHAEWPLSDKVICFSTTANGGVSEGPFASLNLGSHVGDDIANVEENRQRLNVSLAELLPEAKSISWLEQTHSARCVSLDGMLQRDTNALISADAAYTHIKHQACTVMTADCMAIMLADESGKQVASIHAGWRGLIDGVIEQTLSKFTCSPANIHAWFAPAISAANFEVGQEVADLFKAYPASLSRSKHVGKYQLDLKYVASQKLKGAGVEHQYFANICTYARTELFSHRRAQHQKLLTCGRMANLIVIK